MFTASLIVATAIAPIVLRLELPLMFADDSIVAKQSGVERIVHAARQDLKPVLSPAYPFEGDRIYVYGSVWPQTDGTWRLWYGCSSRVVIADTADGVAFDREKLKSCNPVATGFHSPSILLDRFEKDPLKRYKMVGSQFYGKTGEALKRTGYYSSTSADGVHWTPPRQFIQGWWDTVTMTQNPHTGEIMVYFKKQTKWRGRGGCRIVYLTRSADFEIWSEAQLVFAPDEQDDLNWPKTPQQHTEVYNMSVLPHAGGYLSFPTIFRVTGSITKPAKNQSSVDGVIDVQLATSADGVVWNRTPDRRPVVRRGLPGTYDGGTILGMSNSALTTDQESMMYYTAMTTSHGGALPEKKFSIGRAVWRRYGWVSLSAANQGEFVTVPLKLSSSELYVNCRPLATGGNVRVAVLDEEGHELRGLGLDSSVLVKDDVTLGKLSWKSHLQMRPPTDRIVRLKFRINRAEVYSVECRAN